MNKTKYIIASSAVALSLLISAPAFADSVGMKSDTHLGLGFGLGSLIRAHVDNDNDTDVSSTSTDQQKDQKDNDNENNNKNEQEHHSFKHASTTVGTVTSINGSTFVVGPFGKHATTTVTTNASTIFKLNGVATTSAALTTGAHVIVIGTTTATSTSGNSVDASAVLIFTKMFGWFKHWMHIRS